MKFISVLISLTFLFSLKCYSQNFIIDKKEPGSFPIVSNKPTAIYTDKNDDWLIQKVAALFQEDIERVTGQKPNIIHSLPASAKNIIVIGSLAQSFFIKQLVQTKKYLLIACKISGRLTRFKSLNILLRELKMLW